MRNKVLTVTIHDCDLQTFRSGGKGGQNQNKRDTGVRIIHRPSGAVGESREERRQLQNKRTAWKKMANSLKFKLWVNKMSGQDTLVEVQVAESIREVNLKVEYFIDGKWVLENDLHTT